VKGEKTTASGSEAGEQAAVSGIAAGEPEVWEHAARAEGTGPVVRAIVDESLPEHLRKRPRKAWEWPMPTAWLLGTKILGSLRDIVLSSVVKVDLRNWMTAGEVIDLTACERTDPSTGAPCCYIDFLADTGDSQRLVYQLARLMKQKELVVKRWQDGKEHATTLPRGSTLVLGGDTAYPIATHRRLLERIRAPFQWAHDELCETDQQALKRHPVTLLAVPGNHDYYDGLRGFEALAHSPPVVVASSSGEGHRGAESPPAELPPAEQPLRMTGYKLAQHASYFAGALPFGWQLWGIDIEMRAIDDRQLAFFQGAARWEKGKSPPPVSVAKDPAPAPPEKLIVVTSRPAFVYQGPSDHAKVIGPSFKRLGLERAFAHGGELEKGRVRLDLSGDVHVYERYWGENHVERPDTVDEHRAVLVALAAKGPRRSDPSAPDPCAYEPPERYRPVGAERPARKRGEHVTTPARKSGDDLKAPAVSGNDANTATRKRGNDAKTPVAASTSANYASVVSGLGGAFHHPSQVRRGNTPPCATWPSAEHSAREIGVRLVDPYEMFRAGAVGIVGLIIAAACYLLGWSRVSVLGLPLANAKMRPDYYAALGELGLVAVLAVIVLAMIGLPIAAYYLGRAIARPIREMRAPKSRWLRATKAATEWPPVARFLRLLGANPRSTWLFVATIFSWIGTAYGWWWLGRSFTAVAERVESSGLVVIDVLITILVVGMTALGMFRAGQKSPIESWFDNIVRRAGLGVFGASIALLAIWTPYAWIRLICVHWEISLIGLAVAVGTILVRFGHWVFRRGLRARQFMTWLGFLLLVAGALTLPMCFARIHGPSWPLDWFPTILATITYPGSPTPLHAFLMFPLVPIVGAYFACLWVGWYFCICLQWNRHGNEAGSAARVTDFGAFLRIKLTEDKAEVWAISVEEPLAKPSLWCRLLRRNVRRFEPMPTARLIDHFTVERTNVTRSTPTPS
jgi:uncharacterized membrane protein